MASDAAASKRALIVGLLGAGCYPLSLLGAALGLFAFLKQPAPGAPGRTLSIVAMLMPALMLPVAVLEAALVRAPVRQSQVAKLSPECKAQLSKIWAAEQKYRAENGDYTEDRDDLEVGKLAAERRYSYLLGESAWLVKDDEAAKSQLSQLKKLGIPLGRHGGGFSVACVTVLKDWVDVWTVSSEDRELEGGKVVLPAGTVHQEYSGYAK